MIPSHNEESVIAETVETVLKLDYEKFEENEPTPQVYYIEEDNNEKKDL